MNTQNKIIIVNDDPLLTSAVIKRFEAAGVQAVDIHDAQGDFVNHVLAVKPDVIFLDTIMPKISGFDAIKALKNDPETARIPVIFYTNSGREDDIWAGVLAGAVDYLIAADVLPSDLVEIYKTYMANPIEYSKTRTHNIAYRQDTAKKYREAVRLGGVVSFLKSLTAKSSRRKP